MKTKLILLATMAYVAASFPIAALWHVAFFEGFYTNAGYFHDGHQHLQVFRG